MPPINVARLPVPELHAAALLPNCAHRLPHMLAFPHHSGAAAQRLSMSRYATFLLPTHRLHVILFGISLEGLHKPFLSCYPGEWQAHKL